MHEDLDIWKFTYLHYGGKMKLEDPHSDVYLYPIHVPNSCTQFIDQFIIV